MSISPKVRRCHADGVTPLSSRSLYGVMATGTGFSVAQLTVFLPEHKASELQICIESSDGLYTANAVYNVTSVAPGQHVLTFPTEFESTISKYNPADLAILYRTAADP